MYLFDLSPLCLQTHSCIIIIHNNLFIISRILMILFYSLVPNLQTLVYSYIECLYTYAP